MKRATNGKIRARTCAAIKTDVLRRLHERIKGAITLLLLGIASKSQGVVGSVHRMCSGVDANGGKLHYDSNPRFVLLAP